MPEDIEYLRADEALRVLQEAELLGLRDGLAARVFLHTGMRAQELSPLVKRDFDFAAGTVTLRRSVSRRPHLVVPHTKKKLKNGEAAPGFAQDSEIQAELYDDVGLKGRRIVGTPAEVHAKTKGYYFIKRGLKAQQPSRAVPLEDPATLGLLRTWTDPMKAREFLFKGNKGAFWSPLAIGRRLKRAFKAADIDPGRAHPHIFRHTFGVNALKAGRSLVWVQRMMGHTDIKTTTKYLRFVVEDLQDEARRGRPLYAEA